MEIIKICELKNKKTSFFLLLFHIIRSFFSHDSIDDATIKVTAC